MRSIPLIDRLTLEMRGKVTSSTICLADLDNDGEFELCLGTSLGQLAIFKDVSSEEPWIRKTNMGHIVALTAGDVFNIGRNVLVVITADGNCHIFDFSPPLNPTPLAPPPSSPPSTQPEVPEKNDQEVPKDEIDIEGLKITTAETSPEKASVEKASSERASPVKASSVDAVEKAKSASPAPSSATSASGVSSTQPRYQPCFYQRLPPNVRQADVDDVNGDGLNEVVLILTDRVVRTYQWRGKDFKDAGQPLVGDLSTEGELSALSKFEFGDQVGSVAVCHQDGQQVLLVTQPDGILMKRPTQDHFSYSKFRFEGWNDTPPEVICDLKEKGQMLKGSMVLATGNGRLLYRQADGRIRWTLELNTQLYESGGRGGLAALDADLDGSDEIVVPAWNGQTYIIKAADGKASVFHFDGEISGFSCGLFSIKGKPLPVLVYATIPGLVHLYYDLHDFEERKMRVFNPSSKNLRNLSPASISRMLYQPTAEQRKMKMT